MRQVLLSAFFVLSPCMGNAMDWKSASPGSRLEDAQVEVGRFTVKLPPGAWHVIAKGTDRLSGFSGAAPLMLSIALAQIDAGKLVGVLSIVTPANSYARVIWGDTPCKDDTTLVSSKEGGDFRHPECLHIWKATPKATWEALDPEVYFARVAKQLTALQTSVPERAFGVYYSKAYRGDSLRILSMLPGNTDEPLPPAVEAWGQAMRITIRTAVMGDGSVVTVPPLPRP